MDKISIQKKKFFAVLFLMVFFISLFLIMQFFKYIGKFDSNKDFNKLYVEQSIRILDINDNVIADICGKQDRLNISLEEMSPYIVNAVLAIEDIRFYNHRGIDFKGILRAFINNQTGTLSVQGGSTITQQLVKNYFLKPEKTLRRKLIEAIIAVSIETICTKNEILEKYLNYIYWGKNVYGIERAARKYFNKSAKSLSLGESAYLAGLIKRPEYYNVNKNYVESRQRQKIVLQKMYEYGFINEKQMKTAYQEPIYLYKPDSLYPKYSYFLDYVILTLKKNLKPEVSKHGGLIIHTTLDSEIQSTAENTIKQGIIKFGKKNTGVNQGALVSIDVKNGYINAIVGGVNYSKSQFNRAVLCKRPVGSLFKPVVYLSGFITGVVKSDSIINDSPVTYSNNNNLWKPKNWDKKFMGKMTVEKALILSRNIPAVKIAEQTGMDKIVETARLLGIRQKIDKFPSIALGSIGLSPIEIATMYSTLAREGVYIEPVSIRYVTDWRGNVLYSNHSYPVRVIPSECVRELNHILVKAVKIGSGFAANIPGRKVAGKTGTTDEVRDVWFSGYTPDRISVIWLGNDENKPLKRIKSGYCAVLWRNFTEECYEIKNISADLFDPPQKQSEKEKNGGFFKKIYKTKKAKSKKPECSKTAKTCPIQMKPKIYSENP